MKGPTLEKQYRERYATVLEPAAKLLEEQLVKRLKEGVRIDRITVRPKGVDSFLKKAAKKEAGKRKYSDPIAEITDQIGARVIVLFEDDVDPTAEIILKFYAKAEETRKQPESDWEFGYFGVHYLLPLPVEVIPNGVSEEQAPSLFELQIRTLFQHAWSETNHDLGYKPDQPLSSDDKRKLAYSSAQAWGADQVLTELHNKRAKK
jgi:putative GTP pyrophosphokinase